MAIWNLLRNLSEKIRHVFGRPVGKYPALPARVARPWLPPLGPSFPLLQLPESFSYTVATTEAEIEAALEPLLAKSVKLGQEEMMLHLDCEWNMSRTQGVSLLGLMDHDNPLRSYLVRVSYLCYGKDSGLHFR